MVFTTDFATWCARVVDELDPVLKSVACEASATLDRQMIRSTECMACTRCWRRNMEARALIDTPDVVVQMRGSNVAQEDCASRVHAKRVGVGEVR